LSANPGDSSRLRPDRIQARRFRRLRTALVAREAILLMALAGLVTAVGLFGLAFLELLAAAIAVAVLAVIVALGWLLPWENCDPC
jgi:hypothetical protein